MIDIFSRSVPGWLVAPAESAELADAFLADTIARIGVAPGSLLADRGGSMTSKPVAQLLVDLGVARSQPAPRVERQPLQRGQLQDPEYFPEFPGRFGSIEDARAFCDAFHVESEREGREEQLPVAVGLHAVPGRVRSSRCPAVRCRRCDACRC